VGGPILSNLKRTVDRYMARALGVKDYCDRCLETKRWNGNVVLMVVDAAFTSIGLNYFQAVVPKVEEFRKRFVETGRITTLEDLASADIDEVRGVWKNRRSWVAAKDIASHLSKIKEERGLSDREALIHWAKKSRLENWREDGIGRIKGVGINTFQYLRMMGGIDTVMPDKIVKRVIEKILRESNVDMPASNDVAFVERVHKIAERTGYRAIELCWMTWLIQSEAGLSRVEKYAELLPRI
jgi:hypothetical protein